MQYDNDKREENARGGRFPKRGLPSACPAPSQRLEAPENRGQRLDSAWRRQKSEGWRLASAWPGPEAPEHADSIKTHFSDERGKTSILSSPLRLQLPKHEP